MGNCSLRDGVYRNPRGQRQRKDAIRSQRELILLRAADALESMRMEMVDLLIGEAGSTFGKAQFEVSFTVNMLRSVVLFNELNSADLLPREFKNTTVGVIFLGVVSSLIASYLLTNWSKGAEQVQKIFPGNPPSFIRTNSLSGTHWLGKVGRAPASLDILPRTPGGEWIARIRYTGIIEDLAITSKTDGNIVFTGKSYRREIGTGGFALDSFSGEVSPDGQHLRGTLIDGAGLKGLWNVVKLEDPTKSVASETTARLAGDRISTSKWQGMIGKSEVTLTISQQRPSGEWIAHAWYRRVMEELAVIVLDNGTVVLSGRSYQWQSGEGPFSMSTFYGELSIDGTRLQGLRIDTAGNRDPWEITKVASSIESSPLNNPNPIVKLHLLHEIRRYGK